MSSESLEDPPPRVSAAQAAAVARQVFGLEVGDVRELPGERDRNFFIESLDERRYVLKVVHPAEDPAISDFQTRALRHLAAARLPVPAVLSPVEGRLPFIRLDSKPDQQCFVRCVTYIPGTRMADRPQNPNRWRELGRFIGRLDIALEDFSHPAADHRFLWDLKRAGQVRGLVVHVRDPRRRKLVAQILEKFDLETRPLLRRLRSQVIHNDANPQNVLIADGSDQILGIIDFGDTVFAPRVQELAVAIAYQPMSGTEPFRAATEITGGYHEVSPLTEEELLIIPDLVATRLSLTATITSWRATLHGENAAYILRNDHTIATNLMTIEELCSSEGLHWFASEVVQTAASAGPNA